MLMRWAVLRDCPSRCRPGSPRAPTPSTRSAGGGGGGGGGGAGGGAGGGGGATAVASFTVTVAGALSFANNAVTTATPTLTGGQVSYLHAASDTTFHLDSAGGTLLTVAGGSGPTTVTTNLSGAATGFSVSPGG